MKRATLTLVCAASMCFVAHARAQETDASEPEAPEGASEGGEQNPASPEGGTAADTPGTSEPEAPEGGEQNPASPEGGTTADTSGPQPPAVLEAARASLPPSHPPIDETVSVEMSLVVEADGTVSEVTVVNSATPPLDAAAVDALRRSRFTPARMPDGTTFRARIRYRYDFEPPPPPPAGALVVEVRTRANAVLTDAQVRLRAEDGTVQDAVQSGEGWRFEGLAPSAYTLEVHAEGYASASSTEVVEASVETGVLVRLAPVAGDAADVDDDDGPVFGAVAVTEAPPREVTRRTITGAEAAGFAGTRGDALRGLEVLPGVARPAFGSGELIFRGSAPADSQVFLDGVPVPILYHFGGLTSFLPSPLVEQIDFYPSNFGVRYGRRIGGAVEVRARAPRDDRFHLSFDANAVDVSALVETPLGDWGAAGAGFRYSLIGYWLSPLISDEASDIAVPVYLDYQVFALARPSERDELELRSYGSRDSFRFTSTVPEDDNPFETGRSSFSSNFDRVDLTWRHRFGASTRQETVLSAGYRRELFQLGSAERTATNVADVVLRSELQHTFSDAFRLRAGFDGYLAAYELEIVGDPPPPSEGGLEPAELDGIDVRTTGLAVQPALYLEADFYPAPSLQIIAGLRADYFSRLERFTVDPRLALQYRVNDVLRLKAGVGLFSQAPEFAEADDVLGNPELDPIRAVHSSAGFELRPVEGLELGMEGFFKYVYDRVVSTGDGQAPSFITDGIGRIYGGELSLRWDGRRQSRNGERLAMSGPFALLSYTLSRSERRDRDDPWRLFDFDQTHVLSASAGYEFSRGWKLSTLFRLASGNPNTPVQGRIYDSNLDRYRAVYGLTNSGRNGLFHRLDVRIEKTWNFDPFNLTFYIDVQNVYNRTNPEGVGYSYDFRETEVTSGLPIIPAIGLRGAL